TRARDTSRIGFIEQRVDGREFPVNWGESTLYLIDAQTAVKAGPFVLVSKFATRRHPRADLEATALLGMNFLTDNFCTLELSGSAGSIPASLFVSQAFGSEVRGRGRRFARALARLASASASHRQHQWARDLEADLHHRKIVREHVAAAHL